MKQFFKELFENLDLIDKIVLSIMGVILTIESFIAIKLSYPIIDETLIFILAGIAGRAIRFLLIFIVYRAIRIHIKKNKK